MHRVVVDGGCMGYAHSIPFLIIDTTIDTTSPDPQFTMIDSMPSYCTTRVSDNHDNHDNRLLRNLKEPKPPIFGHLCTLL